MPVLDKYGARRVSREIHGLQDLEIMPFRVDVQQVHILNPVARKDIGQRTNLNLALPYERLQPALPMFHDVVSIERSELIEPNRQVRVGRPGIGVHIVEAGVPSRRTDGELLQTKSLRVFKMLFEPVETIRYRLDEQPSPICIGKQNIAARIASDSIVGAHLHKHRLWHGARYMQTVLS